MEFISKIRIAANFLWIWEHSKKAGQLTRMWNNAINENSHNPQFTVQQYQQLRLEGMGDFLIMQMEKLRSQNKNAVDSGLALDVLKFHTTDLGTAVCDFNELRIVSYGNFMGSKT